MSQVSFHRIRQLFDALTDLPPAQRDAFLAAQGDIGAETRRQLQSLLHSDEALAGMTVRPALAAACEIAATPADRSGQRIGAYQLQRELGSGGMGSVYLAERSEGGIAQQVAIKIVHPEMLDASTLARFRLERQVLALLRHPNIASLLDLGELDDGSPYLVIEYVDGASLTDYARVQRLNLRRRLQMLLAICDAVAYAHRNMIVHRDLKPSNVLIDADGRPKLLDFGIAKPLVGHIGAIDVEQTATAQRLFSPSHAAPEQLRGDVITTACDVYGLGTLLYELLADQPPFSTHNRTPGQLERDILEVDPAPPSRRHALNGAATAAAPPRDLDLIALRCLRKQAADRYSSVEALAQDLRRYLAGRPVDARRGNVIYRMGRFIARHRVAVALSAVIASVSLVGAALLARQSQATAAQRIRADEMTGLIIDALRSSDPSSKGARDLSARDVFERVAAQVQAKPDLTPASRALLLAAIVRIDLELGLPGHAQNLIEQLNPDDLSADERDQTRLTKALVLLANARPDEARTQIAAGLASAENPSLRANWQIVEARLDYSQGKLAEALEKIEALPASGLDAETAESRSTTRAQVLLALDKRDLALQEFTTLLAAQRSRLGQNAPAVFDTLTSMVAAEIRRGNYDTAEKLMDESFALAEKLFGRNSVRYGRALSAGHMLERARGNYKKAIDYETQNLAIIRDQYGSVSPNLAKSYFNLGGLNEKLGNLQEAESYFRQSIAMAERVWLPSDMNIFLFRTAFASHLVVMQDRPLDAQEIVRPALRNAEAHAALKEFDIYFLAIAIDKLGDYASQPSAAHRTALAKALGKAISAGDGISYRNAVKEVSAKIRTMGVEPAAEPADVPAK